MPVEFHCQHCDSTLRVSSRKAGLQVTCPRCKQQATVPQREDGSTLAPQPMTPVPAKAESSPDKLVSAPLPSEQPAADPGEIISVPLPPPPPSDLPETPTWERYDDEVTWVYEDLAPQHVNDPQAALIDYDRIALPRYVLLGQGVLLGVVALVSLVLGLLIGRGTAPQVEVAAPARTCYLTGKVSYLSSSGAKVADAGAVVIVVPQDNLPADKAPIEGLRPEDPLPRDEQPAILRIKAIGGDYTRADEQGDFKLRVPKTGEYYVLVVGKAAARKGADKLVSLHLAQMGRYFLPAPDLIGDRKYIWQAESIKRDKSLQFVLE